MTSITNQIGGSCDQTSGYRSRGGEREAATADNREAIMFKKAPDGYVFRAPNPWILGRARFYLVNEAQKAPLLAIITARRQAAFCGALLALIGASTALLAFDSGHDDRLGIFSS